MAALPAYHLNCPYRGMGYNKSMTDSLPIAEFIKLRHRCPILDVRTPAEFATGHLPGAVNVPLFSNAERAEIGTLYKQAGREAAILRGLDFVGPKLRWLVEQVAGLTVHILQKEVALYCWRGGMRSGSVAWLLSLYGYRTSTLHGGYKAFRRYILAAFDRPQPLIILGGQTGAGKTEILHALQQQGQQVIDLEGLACHKGSAFGSFGQPPQPTQQQFENGLGLQWLALDPERPVWLEDESRRIGQRTLPQPLWQQMTAAPTIFVDVPRPRRVERLVAEYGTQDRAKIAVAIRKIEKRLGGQQAKAALAALERGDLAACCTILLEQYYDKTYRRSLGRKPDGSVRRVEITSNDPQENGARVMAALANDA